MLELNKQDGGYPLYTYGKINQSKNVNEQTTIIEQKVYQEEQRDQFT